MNQQAELDTSIQVIDIFLAIGLGAMLGFTVGVVAGYWLKILDLRVARKLTAIRAKDRETSLTAPPAPSTSRSPGSSG